MLNAGILSSSSSLVLVPDLTGLDTLQANSLIQNLQFTPTTSTTTSTGATSSNNGLIASQSLAPNTLAERYTTLSYVIYAYVAPPPPPPPPPPEPPPTYSTWYCSYSGTDGRNRSIQSSDLTDTSGCDYAVVCSPFGYPEYPGYVGCVSFPPPPPPPPPSGGCPSTCDCCGFAGCGYCYIQFGNECFCDD